MAGPPGNASLRQELATLPAAIWIVAAGSFINRFGTFVVPFLVLYLTHEGYQPAQGALAVSAYAAGKIAAGPCGGILTDRLGAKHTTTISMFASAGTTLAVALVPGLWPVIAMATLCGLSSELYRPSTSVIVAQALPDRSRRATAFGVYQLGVSAGTAAGPAVGGVLAEHSFTGLFIADAATSVLWGVIAALALPRNQAHNRASSTGPASAAERPHTLRTMLGDRPLIKVAVVTLLVNIVLFQAQTTLPLWVHHLGRSSAVYGALLAANSILVLFLQLPSTRLVRRYRPQMVIAVTSVIVGGGFALLAAGGSMAVLLGAVAVWSLGELVQWPVAASYVTDLAPDGAIGQYAGTRSLAYGIALLAAPLAGTALYGLSPAALWLSCAAVGIIAAIVMAPWRHRPAPRSRNNDGGPVAPRASRAVATPGMGAAAIRR